MPNFKNTLKKRNNNLQKYKYNVSKKTRYSIKHKSHTRKTNKHNLKGGGIGEFTATYTIKNNMIFSDKKETFTDISSSPAIKLNANDSRNFKANLTAKIYPIDIKLNNITDNKGHAFTFTVSVYSNSTQPQQQHQQQQQQQPQPHQWYQQQQQQPQPHQWYQQQRHQPQQQQQQQNNRFDLFSIKITCTEEKGIFKNKTHCTNGQLTQIQSNQQLLDYFINNNMLFTFEIIRDHHPPQGYGQQPRQSKYLNINCTLKK